MKKNKKTIFILSVIFLALSVTLFVYVCFNKTEHEIPFYLTVEEQGNVERINCWKNSHNEFYIFVPSYADMSNITINLNTESEVVIDDKNLNDGMTCEDFRINEPYDFSYYVFGKKFKYSIMFLKSNNVASIYIDTKTGNMEYIHSKKGNEESGKIRVYTFEGKNEYAGELEAINGRGNNSWEKNEKKPYSIELSQKVNLLGLGEGKKWVLLANADDSSNLRNKIVYDFASKIGLNYSPQSQFVDLYLNGEYAGIYLLSERNEVETERVNISLYDSFLVSLEMEHRLIKQNYCYITTNAKQSLRIHYPQNLSKESLNDIQTSWQSVENAILADDGIDSATGKYWTELIDLDSWVKKYLIEEIFGSGDACYISQFFYRDGDGSNKIYAGPVWDFDHSIGTQIAWQLTNPDTLYANRLYVKDGDETPWFHYIYKKEEFYNELTEVYKRDFLPQIRELLNNDLDNYALQICDSSKMNQIRWSIDKDAVSQVSYIRNFMSKRIEFLSNIWIDNEKYHLVKVDNGWGSFYGWYAVASGETLNCLPTFEEEYDSIFKGFYYSDTNEPFDKNKPITEDIEIYAKWEENNWNKTKDILYIIPILVIAAIFICFVVIDFKRNKRGGGNE